MTETPREASELSKENGKKLDHLIELIKGQGPDSPGVEGRLARLEKILFGKDDGLGLIMQVKILYRVHVYILVSASTGFGFLLREMIRIVWHV